MWTEARAKKTKKAKEKPKSERAELLTNQRRTISFVQAGDPSAGMRALLSSGIAPETPQVFEQLQGKHPKRTAPVEMPKRQVLEALMRNNSDKKAVRNSMVIIARQVKLKVLKTLRMLAGATEVAEVKRHLQQTINLLEIKTDQVLDKLISEENHAQDPNPAAVAADKIVETVK